MHEVSIAMNILQIIEEELSKNTGKEVVHVHLQVGVLSGVVTDSLMFALEASRQNGVLKNAQISIDTLQALARCPECGNEFEAEDYFGICPQCGNNRYDIVSGRELLIKSITLA